jgi:DNA-damage-inducible protein J
MSKSATMHIRVDEDVKNEALQVVEELGLSISSAINMYLKQIVIRREIPFRVSTYPQLNDETIAALEEGDAIASGRLAAKRYQSVDDLFADMDLAP